MPFIHIKSLPFEKPIDISTVLPGINRDFAEKTGIEIMHLHCTWEFYPPGHYAKGDNAPDQQPQEHHPIIVDLLTPDFNDIETIQLMLRTVVESIAARLLPHQQTTARPMPEWSSTMGKLWNGRLFMKHLLCLVLLLAFSTTAVAAENLSTEIDRLLAAVGGSGCTFIRNGAEHGAAAAAAHMRKKRDHFRDQIRIPEDFIRL